MKKVCLLLAVIVCLLAGLAGGLNGQQVAQPPQLPPRTARTAAPPVEPPRIPGYNSIYCSGFIAEHTLQEGLKVVGGQDGAYEFIPGNVVYLNHGANWIVRPGGEYIILRRMVDTDKRQIFSGQGRLLNDLGVVYSEVGRLRINIVHGGSSTAEVLQACESISIGDIAIPFDVKPAPLLKASAAFDQFAPPTGKLDGRIAASKDFGILLRKGDIGYLDVGAKQGAQVGQYFRIYRPFEGNPYLELYTRYRNSLPETIDGMRYNVHLSPKQMREMPREVLGEAVVLHVEGHSATVLVTFAAKAINVGDYVELE